MGLAPKIVLRCPISNPASLEPFVERCLRDGVVLIAIVGDDSAAVEDAIDEIIVGDGSEPSRFIATTCHRDESLADVVEFASRFDEQAGSEVEVVAL